MSHIHRTHTLDLITKEVDSTNGAADFGIAKGELVANDSTNGVVAPANFTFDTDEATTRENFVAAFLGVSMDRVRAGKPSEFHEDPIELKPSIAQDGTFDVLVENGTYEIGDLLGPGFDGGGSVLTNTCKAVGAENQATFVVQEDITIDANTTRKFVNARVVNTPAKRVVA